MNLKLVIELINNDFINMGRSADLLWLQFGEKIKIKNYKNIYVEKGSMGLNVQCPWRMLKQDKIILGNNDIYIPKKESLNFDWWEIGGSIFDEKSEKIINDLLPLKVIDVIVNEIGDFSIRFEKEIVFEVILNGAFKTEFWRFINFKTNEHLVCF